MKKNIAHVLLGALLITASYTTAPLKADADTDKIIATAGRVISKLPGQVLESIKQVHNLISAVNALVMMIETENALLKKSLDTMKTLPSAEAKLAFSIKLLDSTQRLLAETTGVINQFIVAIDKSITPIALTIDEPAGKKIASFSNDLSKAITTTSKTVTEVLKAVQSNLHDL
jgi:hypothetical protein